MTLHQVGLPLYTINEAIYYMIHFHSESPIRARGGSSSTPPLLADMPLPKLTDCCCGCSLKTGTIIIGSLSLAASVLLALMAIWLLASANSFMEILDQALDTGHWNEDKDPDNMIVGESGGRARAQLTILPWKLLTPLLQL